MPQRILHALRTVDSDTGRSIEAICEFHSVQQQYGHVIEIVTVGESGETRLDRLGSPIHRIRKDRGPLGSYSAFIRWMRKHAGAYDCVIVHGIWDYCGLGTWIALRNANVPYFVFTHGALDPWFKSNYPLMHFRRWICWLLGGYPLLRDAHAVFFLSDAERSRARETFWLYDCHEFVVRFGTEGIPPASADDDAEAFLAAHPALRGKRLFTFFSDHYPMEGAHALTAAIARLSREGVWDGRSYRLVIAGSDDPWLKDAVLRLAGLHALGDSVYWAGALTETGARGALLASEVFLRPSAYEICGKRVADALSAGTPVLLTAGVAIWKDIVNSQAGFADEETADGCERLLRRWIGLSGDERAATRERARQCFEEYFTLAGAANALTSAIYLMIGLHSNRRRNPRPPRSLSERGLY